MRALFTIVALIALTACANRTIAPFVSAVPEGATQVPILTITGRAENARGNLSGSRADGARYFANTISIPPGHEPGKVETSYQRPDASRHFVISGQTELDGTSGFSAALRAELAKQPSGDREVMIFIHGYNTSFSDGLFRLAQLKNDLQIPGVAAHFSWPSAANPLGYSQDRDSVLYARDTLQDTLKTMRAATGAPISLVAHSMGSFLVMETLRQIEIESPGWTKRNLNGVVLVAPDISVDVFQAQASRIKDLPQPFFVFTSKRDPALRLSARLNNVSARLGNLTDPEPLGDLPITLIDVSEFGRSSVDRHFVAGTSPALISMIRGSDAVEDAFRSDISGRAGLLPGTVINVRNATQVILSPGLVTSE